MLIRCIDKSYIGVDLWEAPMRNVMIAALVFYPLSLLDITGMAFSQPISTGLPIANTNKGGEDESADFNALIDLLTLAGKNLADHSPKWSCVPTSKFLCSEATCKSIQPTVTVFLDFPMQKYQRCDEKGCTTHQLSKTSSGIYTVATPSEGAFLKALNDGRSFVEVATLGFDIHLSYGACSPAK